MRFIKPEELLSVTNGGLDILVMLFPKTPAFRPREIQVATLIGKGFSDKVICFELDISQDTLRNHKDSIGRKAGVFGKVGIAVLAHKFNLI